MEVVIFLVVIGILAFALSDSSIDGMDKTTYISYIERDDQGRAIKDSRGNYKITRMVSGTNPRTPKSFWWNNN